MAYTITSKKRTHRLEWTREPTLSALLEDPIVRTRRVGFHR